VTSAARSDEGDAGTPRVFILYSERFEQWHELLDGLLVAARRE
jgi:hypothetical protein